MSISEKQTRAEGTEERQTSLVEEGVQGEIHRERERRVRVTFKFLVGHLGGY